MQNSANINDIVIDKEKRDWNNPIANTTVISSTFTPSTVNTINHPNPTINSIMIPTMDPEINPIMKPKMSNIKKNTIHGLSGIINNGNTCYINSALQAIGHLNPLTTYFFEEKENIYQILKRNARKILKNNSDFRVEIENHIPMELKKKIHDPEFKPEMLNDSELCYVYNHTITAQLIRLLEYMWERNCTIQIICFRKIFNEIKNKFFCGYVQHDVEEAYSTIIYQIQEELSEKKNVKIKTNDNLVKEFIEFKNTICKQIKQTNSVDEKQKLLVIFAEKAKQMSVQQLKMKAFKEMQTYYMNNLCRITDIFAGMSLSCIKCPDQECNYVSHTFSPFVHLQIHIRKLTRKEDSHKLTLDDCLQDYCKEEVLDENNLYHCEGCKKHVPATKILQLWTCPVVLVIHLARFIVEQPKEMRPLQSDLLNIHENMGNTIHMFKNNRFVKFPLEHLDISSMISSINYNPNNCYKYTLQCVVNHVGGIHNGHYYTYCKDEDSNRWFNFNDERVHEIKECDVVTENAYILFYLREDMINQ